MVQNNAAAEKSRKTSRLSKGLNPDVPRPAAHNVGIFYLIQLHQKIKNKLKVEKPMRKQLRSQKWTNTEFPLKNSATDLEQILKLV